MRRKEQGDHRSIWAVARQAAAERDGRLAFMLLTAFVVVLFWDNHRLLVLGGFTALFFVAGFLAWNESRRVAREKSRLFSTSLTELTDDRDQLALEP